MPNNTQWFTKTSKSRYQINSKLIYQELVPQILNKLENNILISDILAWIKQETIAAFKNNFNMNPEVGALNNSVGRWNELIAISLLSEIAFEISQEKNATY